MFEFPASNLFLYLAKKDGRWLTYADPEVGKMVQGEVSAGATAMLTKENRMSPMAFLDDASFGFPDVENANSTDFHVLVELPKPKRPRVEATGTITTLENVRTDRRLVESASVVLKLTAIAPALLEARVGTVLEMPESVLGTNMQNGLYIRQDCGVAPDDSSCPGARSPGIGKSVFGIYVLLMRMAKRQDVAYQPRKGMLLYFTWNRTSGRYEVSRGPRAGRNYDGLLDGREGEVQPEWFTLAFLFASPSTENYNDYVKELCFKVYMNPWTKAECQRFAEVRGLEDHDEWYRRFNLVGGNPRYVFSSREKFDHLVRSVKARIPPNIDALKERIWLVKLDRLDDHMKHIAFLLYRNENSPSRAYLVYACLALEAIMSARYQIGSADQLHSLLGTPAAKAEIQSWRGKEIEKFLLQDLATNTFCMRPLGGSETQTVTRCGPLNATSTIIQANADIQNELALYIPLTVTFPAIDGVLVVPGARRIVYVQSTVSTAHPIVYQRLKDVYEELTQRQEFTGYAHILLFIVSSEIYDRFSIQPYKSADGINEHKASVDIGVTQYVGKIIRGVTNGE